ncbi:hypothetical protein SAMN05421493_1132 [Pseudobutyrivibrio sp. 49]|uniref:hypothetical protein n=1 Tax=Pseudobutyrivibrio sp. 49 TaxID=1855344 RepID=UPI00088B1104|nr:hypothetical protein [Pseudobutyrivibrio sp. 49]SDI37970.1 hypothetical protein SAMN05421493_1132 [Pseudobutyrivibrio sp. 49]
MKLKRILAVAMATTMVLGMSMTALAADGDATGNGSSEGNGTSEGHVEQKHMNVVLPTNVENVFAYTIDPERLIQTTKGGKYDDGTVFPEAENDKGVYFLVGEKTYANTSKELQVINKSSADVKVSLTVKTVANAGSTDIALADAALDGSEEDPTLYLAATIGEGENKATQILSGTPQTIDRKLEGTPSNYEIIVGENASHEKEYQYKQKTSGLATWKALKFSVSGAVTEGLAIDDDTTAPKINVTWSFAEPTSTDTNLSTDGVGTYSEIPATSSAGAITVPSTGGATVAITVGEDGAVPTSLTNTWYSGNMLEMTNGYGAAYDESTNVITFESGITTHLKDSSDQYHADAVGATYTITFTPEEGEPYTQQLTIAE